MNVVELRQPDAARLLVAGGKGANLGQLVAAGFEVPPGFVVTTAAYRSFFDGVAGEVATLLGDIDFDDLGKLEEQTARIRALVRDAPVPAGLAAEIADAYERLGAGGFVAVRSSGTAEDLEGTSFAGLHDTYLDVLGADGVLAAVRRCWASLWTARAAIYRQRNGFDHSEAQLAVVVQQMVRADVSGVMFTGNPLTAATDEIVVNASWGLGEAIVRGIVSPDQFVLHAADLAVIERATGSKAVQIVGDAAAGSGVVEQEVPADRRDAACLGSEEVTALGRLGLAVQAHYGGMPQDVEWAIADGTLYLLQSRPVTGIDFSWDADCEDWQHEPADPHAVWTRVPMDDIWTGAITPLMYSFRGKSFAYDARSGGVPILGTPEIKDIRAMKYFRGQAYMDARVYEAWTRCAPPPMRPGLAAALPPEMRDDAISAPFSWLRYPLVYARAKILYPEVGNPYGWVRSMEDYNTNRVEEANGLSYDELALLSDDEIRRYIGKQVAFEGQYNYDIAWPGLFLWARDIFTALFAIVTNWYDGDNEYAFTELIAGCQNITKTIREHIMLHEMGKVVRGSSRLSEDFARLRDDGFFESLPGSSDGQVLDAMVQEFLEHSRHRGHADRDIYFPRYGDDLAVLYRALEAHVRSDIDPLVRERFNNERRDEVAADVEANLRRKPLGALRAEAFKWCLEYVMRFQEWRDNERYFIDRSTYSIRKAFVEVNRRLQERGLVETDRDFWFLTETELFDLLAGRANLPLTRAKVRSRMRNFDDLDSKEFRPPKFLHRNRAHSGENTGASMVDGQLVLRGIPTSRGTVTGTARIIKQLSEIGRVNRGEILIANSTDPGWTPVFALIDGVIVETGGMLSHSSCLAREYGFPAAQVEGALGLIPDGATITLNGDTGEVRVLEPL